MSNSEWQDFIHNTEEPKDRLKRARAATGVSIDQLAEKVGLKPSAVRAHESGQNKIKPSVAELYANALRITPEWLLFGRGVGPNRVDDRRLIQVPIVGEINAGVWVEREPFTPRLYVPFFLPGYAHIQISGWRVDAHAFANATIYNPGTYMLTAGLASVPWHFGDPVVVIRRQGPLYETSLMSVEIRTRPKRSLLLRVGSGEPEEFDLSDDAAPEIAGVVIGTYALTPAPRQISGTIGGDPEARRIVEQRAVSS